MRIRNSILIAGLAAASAASAAFAQPYGDPAMWHPWGWGGMFIGPVMMIVFLAVLVGAVVLVVRWLGGGAAAGGPGRGEGTGALDVLKERYARGEIDSQEYQERRRVLLE